VTKQEVCDRVGDGLRPLDVQQVPDARRMFGGELPFDEAGELDPEERVGVLDGLGDGSRDAFVE
jgi:hypothetical protein